VKHLRALLLSITAILACALPGILAASAAARPSSAGTSGVTSPLARAATHSGANRRRRPHSACPASHPRHAGYKGHKGYKGHVTCRAHKTHKTHARSAHSGKPNGGALGTSTSHAARNRPAKRSHGGRHTVTGATHNKNSETVSVSGESGQTIASVLATPCENTELTPNPGNLEAIDAATLCLVNQERARNGELPLRPNAQLEQAAQGHSEEMVEDDYFAHVAPSGLTPVARVEETGYLPNQQVGYTLGENIAWGTLQLSTPAAIVAAWIASPEHLANILFSAYRDTAIGVAPEAPASLAEGQPGAVYSQEFGVIVD
jgi:uncharacterized protein YkwD